MSGYVYLTDDQRQRANAVDLEDFLVCQRERLLRPGREKRLDSDHSITMRGNEWYDHATGEDSLATDSVQMFYGKSFPSAVTMLLDGEQGQPYRPGEQREPELPKPFVLPKAHSDMRRVSAYLTKTRYLNRNVVSTFARVRLVYEDDQHHSVVFIGVDKDGVARHVYKRGTYTRGDVFKENVDGCDPKYSFHFASQNGTVYVFEASIDLLPFISLYQGDWEKHNYVALCGVSEQALIQHLVDSPQIQKTGLCPDYDRAGTQARERIGRTLSERGYENIFSLFSCQKNWDEDLQALREQVISQITEQKKTT